MNLCLHFLPFPLTVLLIVKITSSLIPTFMSDYLMAIIWCATDRGIEIFSELKSLLAIWYDHFLYIPTHFCILFISSISTLSCIRITIIVDHTLFPFNRSITYYYYRLLSHVSGINHALFHTQTQHTTHVLNVDLRYKRMWEIQGVGWF